MRKNKDRKRTDSKKKTLREHYKDCLDYFIDSRWYFVFALGVFGIIFLIGFVYPVFFKEQIIELLKGLTNVFGDKNFIETFLAIFFNNAQAGFFAMAFGIFFGIFPLITLIVNSYLLGFVSRMVAETTSILDLWMLFPHGIFELPAILVSIGIGLRLGTFPLKKKKNMKKELTSALKFYLLVILPILLLAALIETILIFSYS